MADASRDQNFVPTLLGVSNVDGVTPVKVYADPVTHRLLIDSSGGGSGTVTDVSVVTANGFAGTVATSTTTPAITLTTTITGVLKGDGTAISTASPSTDYAALAFKTIAVATQSDVVADTPIDTLTLVAGTGMTITTNAGTDTITFAASGGAATSITVGTTTITSGTTTRILYDNAGVLGEYTITGTGTVVAMQTSPTFVTDITTPIIKLSGTSNQAVFQSAGVTGTLTWTPTSTNKTITFPDRTLTVDNITTATTTNGTGFLKGNGTAISFDNSTYLTTLTVGATTITSGTSTRILYDNAGTLGEYTLTGSGTVVMMQTAPTFVTSMTGPLLIGGSGTTGTQLTLKTTTGNGTTDALAIVGGNNGGTTFATFSASLLALAAGSITMTGSLAATGARVTKGWFTDIESTNAPTVGGVALPTASSTTTLTNKRITRRIVTVNAPGATPTTNSDNDDIAEFTGLNTAITSMTTNLSGTPVNGDLLEFRFLDDGTARAITWGASFAASTVALPTTTVISTMLRVLFEYQTTASLNKWVCVAVA